MSQQCKEIKGFKPMKQLHLYTFIWYLWIGKEYLWVACDENNDTCNNQKLVSFPDIPIYQNKKYWVDVEDLKSILFQSSKPIHPKQLSIYNLLKEWTTNFQE